MLSYNFPYVVINVRFYLVQRHRLLVEDGAVDGSAYSSATDEQNAQIGQGDIRNVNLVSIAAIFVIIMLVFPLISIPVILVLVKAAQ